MKVVCTGFKEVQKTTSDARQDQEELKYETMAHANNTLIWGPTLHI